jgi:Type ISP C-terminal specificity domain
VHLQRDTTSPKVSIVLTSVATTFWAENSGKFTRLEATDSALKQYLSRLKCSLAQASEQTLADAATGMMTLDSEATLIGAPSEAWKYTLGNRNALEWFLDQYKEKKPKNPTIREKFDTYRLADYDEKVIDLLMRATTVSVEAVAITEAIKTANAEGEA